jgi:hypothetical protein
MGYLQGDGIDPDVVGGHSNPVFHGQIGQEGMAAAVFGRWADYMHDLVTDLLAFSYELECLSGV